MTRSPGRRPETSERGPLPAIGQDAIAGQPFPPKHWRERTIRPAPPELLAKVMRDDDALNAIRRKSIEPSRTEKACWALLGVLAVVSVYLIASM